MKVNDDKWEITKITRDKDREKEMEWRNTKKLGSLLGGLRRHEKSSSKNKEYDEPTGKNVAK